MLPVERRKKMLTKMSQQEMVTIQEFMETFGISIETVRRDLNLLEKQGKIEKIYGGAKIKEVSYNEPTMNHRMINNQLYKEAIGKACSQSIEDGDCIYIDSGSTTFHIAKYIKKHKKLTIITNSLPIVSELSMCDFDIILIGGRFRRSEQSIVTFNYMFNFNQLNIQKCFICASGITVENGISDYDMHEVETRKEIIKRSKEIFVAADSSKFGLDVLVNVAPIDAVDHIVTDSSLSAHYLDMFNEMNTDIILAPL